MQIEFKNGSKIEIGITTKLGNCPLVEHNTTSENCRPYNKQK